MPRGNGTGPAGMGPMTGRGLGYCAGYARPGFANFGYGMGRGAGRGMGRGYFAAGYPAYGRYSWNVPPVAAEGYDEMSDLKYREELLEDQLKQIKDRLANLESEK